MPATCRADLVLDLNMTLGEGPIWHHDENRLYFVDIEGHRLHSYEPATDRSHCFEFDRMVTAAAAIRSGGLLLAQEDRITRFFPDSGREEKLLDFEADQPGNRSNDGKAGPDGRFYIGTMARDASSPDGGFYRLDPNLRLTRLLADRIISNGLCWSHDQSTLYYIDTPTQRIDAFDFDAATGGISNERVAVNLPDGRGMPDGMTIDTEGKLWVAHHGGHCVGRYNPVTGEALDVVDVPAPFVTSCFFGGPQYDTLYITTAREGMSAEQQEQYPQSGGLFRVRTGHRGVPAFVFNLT